MMAVTPFCDDGRMSSAAGSGNDRGGGIDTDHLFAMVAAHAHLDLTLMTRAGLQGELSLLGKASGWIAARRAQVARALLDLAEPGTSPENDVASASRSSLSKANAEVKRAATLGEVPEVEDALAAGDVSTDHVDRLTGALDRLGERRGELAADGQGLANLASRTTPEQFSRKLEERIARLDETEGCVRLEKQQRANRFRTWTDQITGMLRMAGELDPATGLAFIAALEAAVEAMFHGGVPPECPDGENRQDWLRAMALVRLVTGVGSAVPDDEAGDIETVGDHIDLVVVVDWETMLHGLHERSIIDPGHDLDLPVASYRRLACTAGIIPIVLGSNGVVLDEGRRTRLATKQQRRALRTMYPTCAIPGCHVLGRHCEPHHVRWWVEHLGPTDLSNLLPLCSRHHHAVHEGGWLLVLHADRSLTITYPDGSIQTTGPPRAQQAA